MLSVTGEGTNSSSLPWEQLCRRFSLAEIRSATQNFDDALVIGEGGFGKVYKGPINNDGATNFAAMKRLDARSNQGAPEFQAEIEMLSKLRHCHLVSLIGYCNDGEEMILVYDYMPHGTLEDHLHRMGTSLTWLQRLKICIGAARGLDYLHTGTGTQHGVIHRDVKTSNILLDENWDAKISDFGLSKIGPTNQPRTYVSTGVKGTFGYLDPEYFSTGRLTRKSDVYAFGVVLFETLCGRRAVDTTLNEEQWGLAGWAQDCIKERKLDKIIDSGLRGQISPDSLKEFARIANSCLRSRPKERPTMAEVVVKLERTFCLQERMDSTSNKRTFIGKMRLFFSVKLERRLVPPLTEVESDGISVRAVGTAQTEVAPHGKASANLVLFDDSFVFTLEELLGSSAEFISKSTYWTTYKASLGDGYQVVIKRKRNMLIHSQFEVEQHEVAALGEIRHPNILALRGYYWSREEKLCIYDYMPIGSVSSLLHSHGPQSATQWPARMNIIMGITRGLFYLHSQEKIVHGNLTTSNILLDNHFNPVIADVGLSRHTSSAAVIYTATAGKPSNHAPELLEGKSANSRTDIYSLGVIMLELLTGISTGKETDVPSLPHWVKSQIKEKTVHMFDRNLEREATNAEDDLFQTLNVALLCVETSPAARPEAQQILQMLEEIKPDPAASVPLQDLALDDNQPKITESEVANPFDHELNVS